MTDDGDGPRAEGVTVDFNVECGDFDPSDCAGGLCRPERLPARWGRFDHCVWSRAPGELWWRRYGYATRAGAESIAAADGERFPGAEFAVRPNDAGPPLEDGA